MAKIWSFIESIGDFYGVFLLYIQQAMVRTYVCVGKKKNYDDVRNAVISQTKLSTIVVIKYPTLTRTSQIYVFLHILINWHQNLARNFMKTT